ncbi:MAG: hypothetical protein JSS65_12925 [Armatimonadetes bacterium]|nr:hypothetical protein [Armatimonadota bacterium]
MILTTLAATLLLSQQATAAAKPADSPTLAYTGVLALDINGDSGKLSFTAKRTVTKTNGESAISFKLEESKLEMGGNEQTLPDLDAYVLKTKADGTVSSLSGGIPELPAGSFLMLMHYVGTKEPLAVDGKASVKVAKTDDAPAFNVSVKRLADDKVDGDTLQVFEQSVKSDGDDSLDSVGKFWAKADGTVVKISQEIKSIVVGGGGGSAKGTLTLNLKK